MKVIYKAPGCAPEPRDIPNTLEELQATVGGYIETVTIATDAVKALLHREALDHMIVMLKLLDSFLGLQQLNVSIRFRHF